MQPKPRTGPKYGPGGKRNKKRICITSDVESYWTRGGDTLGEAIETSTRKKADFKQFLKSHSAVVKESLTTEPIKGPPVSDVGTRLRESTK